jgi:thymidine kinase
MPEITPSSFTPAKKHPGQLEVICGSMFSGKTEELMRRLRRAEFARQNILTIKHLIDTRAHHQCIISHDGQERSAHPIDNTPEGIKKILSLATPSIDVVGIDELQFFPKEIISILLALVAQGRRVIVAGLDLDFRGEPFGVMPAVMALADSVTKLNAICSSCGKQAHYSQRTVNGEPATYDAPLVMVGASEAYEPRCRSCFVIDKNSISSYRDDLASL